jgi:transposase, IS5 family
MKVHLTADDMHIWGIEKVKTHQYLNAIVLLASALTPATQQKEVAA